VIAFESALEQARQSVTSERPPRPVLLRIRRGDSVEYAAVEPPPK